LEFKQRLIESYECLSVQQSDDTARTIGSNFGQKWGWYPSIDTVAKGRRISIEDATELNVHVFLYDLEYRIDLANEEAKQINKNE
jgi:hypothetical protein